ncbi:thiamine diphosphokinase [Planomicrobium sp. CPCC 101079]|uniref:thiamine diphosphokinase n=1 Tax=Planomicrobium sp. CPCC 101079 TaxID=2599618 RepID=UPI0011B399F3|nr:thiamine diphosphokinase [Planomicrobium sp. CPCC 101079]TWT04667.1 thiamine diphosphokinase [Planomicrobium sp. CPCC 101079]
MKVVLVAGGPAAELPDLASWPEAVFMGVDAGTVRLLEQGITPSCAVGDFDSVSEKEYEEIERLVPDMVRVASEKDETDTELALEKAMSIQPETVVITGVTGGRLDHYMSALHAIYSYQQKFPEVQFFLVNHQNRIRFLDPGSHLVKRDERYRFISFYPFAEEVEGLTLESFKYEVQNESVAFGSTRFISNELQGEGTVSFTKGSCIMIESAD